MRLRHLFLTLIFTGCAAADIPVQIAPPPAWIAASATPALAATPAEQASYGYDYLLLDRQVNVRAQSTYVHTVYRITASSYLQSGARISWDYDPAYEQLSFNHLHVIRDGVVQDRLHPDTVKTIQQERDLDRHMLNGQLTALVLLDDIRVDDVIDYAVTLKGWNPAFGGRFFDSLYDSWSVPVRHQRFRLVTPADRTVRYRESGASPLTLTTTGRGDDQVLTWEGRDLKPLDSEKETPGWFDPYSYLQFSEFTRWSDVVNWALPLYALPENAAPSIQTKSDALTAGLATANDKTVALLQFVQQDIRYLGMELGAGCYKPTDPAEVLSRRFGDCKGKTLLFCALMRAAGLVAYPSLLNTDYRDKIAGWLPSPQAFDHVIAAIPKTDGGYWWVDPTRTHQAGDLGCRGLPDYRRALVIRPGGTDLTVIDQPPESKRTIQIEETFDIPAFDQPASFRVVTRYSGTSADSTRSYFSQNTPEQISKDYVNYYSSDYPGLTAARPATLADDVRRNIVTVDEHYSVPKLWETLPDKKSVKAFFYPRPITDYAVRPDTPVRTMPLAVDYPVKITLSTTVNLPKTWKVTPNDDAIETPAFRASGGISGHDKIVVMHYAWESLSDHVPVAQVADYLEKINRYRNSLGYSLTYNYPAPAPQPPPPPPFRLNWMLTFVATLTLGAMTYVSVRLHGHTFKTPPPLVSDQDPSGLGGWLVLVGIGVILRPAVLLVQSYAAMHPSFDQSVWDLVATPGGASYQKGLGPLVIFEVVGNIILIVASVLMIPLFLGKKRVFPAVAVAYFAFNLLFLGMDTWISSRLPSPPQNGHDKEHLEVVRMAVIALVWIPYMLKSKRVQATFTR